MEFSDVVRSRRMTRSFSDKLVDDIVIHECIELASRAPSAGKSQGWHLVVFKGADTRRYWDIALPSHRRDAFVFPGLLEAPVVAVVLADPTAYTQRYSEIDKSHTGLGSSVDNWPAPYWTIDASFATMTFLLALEDRGLGALFFAHAQEDELRKELFVPKYVEILGTIACGFASDEIVRQGVSAYRARRSVSDIIHLNRW